MSNLVRDRLPCIAVLAALLCLIPVRSDAQVIPPGSYQQSCQQINVLNVVLVAQCRTRAGNFVNARLQGFALCIGDIANLDGVLACNFANPPTGSYEQTCRDVWAEQLVLHASCQDGRGNFHVTSLAQWRNCVGDVWNNDGTLTCTFAQPPSGSYTASCDNIWVRGSDLFARCRKLDGTWMQVGFLNYPSCTRDLANSDGAIVCAVANRLEYAQACAAMISTIPDFNCMTGTELPITFNGVVQTTAVGNCDKPVVLGLSNEGQCVPFSRLVRIDTQRADVQTVAICRKYHARPANSTIFDDIAMIQHDNTSGMTCFYQSRIEAGIDGTLVPSPMSSSQAASNVWLDTHTAFQPPQEFKERWAGGPGGIPCVNCHDADAFIWSPYVSQAVGSGGWQPLGPYRFDAFGIFLGPATHAVKPTNATLCVSCHRIGINSWKGIAKFIVDWMPLTNGTNPTVMSNQWSQAQKDAFNEVNWCVDHFTEARCNAE
jgi:hypothetical protein